MAEEPNHAPDAVDRWLENSLNVRFRNVWFYVRDLTKSGSMWVDEHHVDDPEIFDMTVDMSCRRLGARYALYEFDSKWVLVGGRCGYAREYPTREAAEMVAIHNG